MTDSLRNLEQVINSVALCFVTAKHEVGKQKGLTHRFDTLLKKA